MAEVIPLETLFAPVREDCPRLRGAVIRFMALPAPRIPLGVFSASGLYRWGAAGLTIAPLDQDFPWFAIARVQFLGTERQASPHAINGVVRCGLPGLLQDFLGTRGVLRCTVLVLTECEQRKQKYREHSCSNEGGCDSTGDKPLVPANGCYRHDNRQSCCPKQYDGPFVGRRGVRGSGEQRRQATDDEQEEQAISLTGRWTTAQAAARTGRRRSSAPHGRGAVPTEVCVRNCWTLA